jgi:hypothetical protein
MVDGGELVEGVRVGRDQHAARCARCRCDLEIVRSARAARASCMSQQDGVVSGDVDVEGDDVEGGEDRVDPNHHVKSGRCRSGVAERVNERLDDPLVQSDQEPRCRAKTGSAIPIGLDVVHAASLAPRLTLSSPRDTTRDSGATRSGRSTTTRGTSCLGSESGRRRDL